MLRGDVVDNPKYAGQRVFSTGINLTHLYHGKISYMWYVTREMGFVNKMMRGLARPDADPDEIYGGTIEKPWIAARRGISRSAAAASTCSRWTTWWRRATPT